MYWNLIGMFASFVVMVGRPNTYWFYVGLVLLLFHIVFFVLDFKKGNRW